MAKESIKINCKGAGTIAINLLEPIQGTLKVLTKENHDKLKNHILKEGFIEPLSIWEDKETGKVFVLNGHQRLSVLLALKKEGYKIPQIPINYVEAKDINEAKLNVLSLASQYGSISTVGLSEYSTDLGLSVDALLSEFNFPEIDVSALFSEVNKEVLMAGDFEFNPVINKEAIEYKHEVKIEPPNEIDDLVPELPKKPKAKLGDIYKLGNHRLMCGDSTSIDAVDNLMDGQKADMVFTDPPYGMFLDTDYTGMNGLLKDGSYIKRNNHKKVIGDHDDFKPELISTIFAAFPDAKEVFLWGADYYADILPNRNEGSWVVWDKTGNEDRDKGFGSSFELCWSKQKHKRTFARIWWQGIFGVKDDQNGRVHPTQKPVQLAEWFFDRWGKETKSVVDLFGGSGSTLIACEKTNRKCFMIELDPHYIDVIIARWEKYTGQKAIKLPTTKLKKK